MNAHKRLNDKAAASYRERLYAGELNQHKIDLETMCIHGFSTAKAMATDEGTQLMLAKQIMWSAFFEPINEYISNSCMNSWCCNPRHLEVRAGGPKVVRAYKDVDLMAEFAEKAPSIPQYRRSTKEKRSEHPRSPGHTYTIVSGETTDHAKIAFLHDANAASLANRASRVTESTDAAGERRGLSQETDSRPDDDASRAGEAREMNRQDQLAKLERQHGELVAEQSELHQRTATNELRRRAVQHRIEALRIELRIERES